MHLVVSAEDGHLLEVLCKGILQSVQRSAVAFGSSLQKALCKGKSQGYYHYAGSWRLMMSCTGPGISILWCMETLTDLPDLAGTLVNGLEVSFAHR